MSDFTEPIPETDTPPPEPQPSLQHLPSHHAGHHWSRGRALTILQTVYSEPSLNVISVNISEVPQDERPFVPLQQERDRSGLG